MRWVHARPQSKNVIQNTFVINARVQNLYQTNYRTKVARSQWCKRLASFCVSSWLPLVRQELAVTRQWLDFS